MDKDNRESKGRGTLLLVMKRELKAWVSLLKGTYGIWPEAIKPSHRHWSQAGRKYFAHQSLVFGMDGHPLVKLTYMLYEVCSTVIHSESRLMESPRELSPFYLVCEG